MNQSNKNIYNPGDLHSLPCLKVYLLIFVLAMLGSSNTHATNTHNLNIASFETIDLDKETPLYSLLLAEIALNRGQYQIALKNYLKAAYITKDPGVAEEATLLAIALEAPAQAIQASELWAKLAQDNLQAQLVATTLTIGQSLKQAVPYLTRAIEIDPEEVEKNIIDVQIMLSEKGARNLEKATDLIAKKRPQDAQAHLIAALCAATLGEMEKSIAWVDSALKQAPDLTHAIELKARLIRYENNSDENALAYLKQKINQYPKDAELRFFYANALLDIEKTDDAEKEFLKLTKDSSFGGASFILLSEISFDKGDIEQTLNNLKKALAFKETRETARYLLGQIEEQLGNVKEAIFWYSDIDSGPYHVPSIIRAVSLLKINREFDQALSLINNSSPSTLEEQKELLVAEIDLMNLNKKSEKAMELANDLLQKLPNDSEFLLMRALTAINLNQLSVAEKDVRLILKNNPNHANALSILGYILSQNDTRLNEALNYLKQALALSPDNPAFMDTMGWTYYRLGDIKNALTYLEKANTLTEDSEIAAHFGEVLWMNNNKKEAISVWKKAMDRDDQDEALLNTLDRLNVDLKSNKKH